MIYFVCNRFTIPLRSRRRRMSEASIQKLKSLAAKVRASEAVDTTENETSDDTTRDKSDEATSSESKSKKSKVNHTQCLTQCSQGGSESNSRPLFSL